MSWFSTDPKYNFEFPYLYDSTQEVAKNYKAICTPDFFGFNADLKLQYRGRIDSSVMNDNTNKFYKRELFNAMKMVSVAKLRKAQKHMEQARPYSDRLKELIAHLTQDIDRSILDLLKQKDKIKHVGFLIVTADRGLAGSFNSKIIKKAEIEINLIGKENAKLFCVGKKGFEYFSKRNYNVIDHYTDFWIDLNYNH